MKEVTLEDKLIKIRALLGFRTWQDVSLELGLSKYAIGELKRRATKSNLHRAILVVDQKLKELMNN